VTLGNHEKAAAIASAGGHAATAQLASPALSRPTFVNILKHPPLRAIEVATHGSHPGGKEPEAPTLSDIFVRLDNFGAEVEQRIESPEYLALVKKAFRSWDEADTTDKKQMFKKLITNAAAIRLCPDDLIRLFLHWIEQYHETHFVVIKEIYRHPESTRGAIWDNIRGSRPREDSSEADLFRYLIRELSTGGVIRQARETDMAGHFLKRDARGQSHQSASRVMESAFESTKPYVLSTM
jgi:hypothetical protein